MTQPDQIAEPQDLPSRLAMLHQQGHDYLDPGAQLALAQSDTSNSDLTSIANGIKNAVQNSYDGLTRFFTDPVLHQEPSASVALQRYVNSAIGPQPIAETDLVHIQGQLQKYGFGKDLPVTGSWDASWNAAYNQATQKHTQDQLNGNKPGSVTVGHALHGFLNYLLPTHAVNAVVGFAKSIPADVRDVLADNIGLGTSAVDFAGELTRHMTDPGQAFRNAREAGRNTALNVNHALLGHQSKAELIHDTTGIHILGKAFDDIGTVLLISGIGSEVGAAGRGVSAAVKGGLFASTEQAVRGPGLIARNVFGGLTKEQLGKVAADGADMTVQRRVLLSKSFQNMPVLGRAAPLLGRLSDSDGLWYRARAVLDKPYDYGIVRGAGQVVGQTQLASMKIGAVATVSDMLNPGGGNTLSSSIAGTHVLDGVDDSIRNHLGVEVYGHHFGVSINDIAWLLHAPVSGSLSLSEQYGDHVQKINDGITHKLGQTGAITEFEQATGQNWNEFMTAAGGQHRANAYLFGKVIDHAAAYGADRELQGSTLEPFSEEWTTAKRAIESRILNDNDLLIENVKNMLGGTTHYFQNAIAKELTQANKVGKDALRRDVNAYLDSANDLSTHVLPNAEHILSLPLTAEQRAAHEAYTTAQTADEQDRAFYDTIGAEPPPARTGTIPKIALPTGSIGQARFEALRDAEGNVRYDKSGNVMGDPAKSTLTAQQHAKDLKQFEARAAQIEASGDEVAKLQFTDELRAYGLLNFGLDATKAKVWSDDPAKLIEVLRTQGQHLAGEIHLLETAPQAMRDAINRMKIAGYQPVTGTDIGHAFRNDLPFQQDLLGDPIKRSRKIASALGLNTQHFSGADQGIRMRMRIVQEFQKEIDEKRIVLPPHTTANTILSVLQNPDNLARKLPWSDNVAFALSRKAQEGQIQRIASAEGISETEAAARLAAEIAHAGGLRDIRLPEFRRILTEPGEEVIPVHLRSEITELSTELPHGWFSERDANRLYLALQRAYADRPAFMVGAQAIESRLRNLPFSTREKLTKGSGVGKLPDAARPFASNLAAHDHTMFMLNLPNQLAQLRDKYRFTLSPFFSLRRITKTNVKMSIEGVQPTLNPVGRLLEQGAWNDSHDLLDRALGANNPAYKFLDEADRYLHGQDVVGLYNSRHYGAYIAHELSKQGMGEEEIAQKVRKIMTYGTRKVEGRTAMEQTVNTIFFPFSFEKTVIRNIGGYLLDRPAQAMVLSNALDAYRDFNNHHLNGNNPIAASWWEQHVPLLNEALRLNAFEHGISPGQLGGINAPLLNIFLPQSYSPTQDLQSHLTRLIPAVTDLKRILKEGSEQSRIIRTSLVNGVSLANDHLTGRARGPLDFRPSNKTDDAQRQEAFDLRNKLVEAFQPVLDYNGSTSEDVNKYHWPSAGPGADKLPDAIRGQVIGKESIGILVSKAFPVYSPSAGAGYAIAKQIKANEYVSQQIAKNPARGALYKDFLDKARTAIGHLNGDDYPAEQAAQVTALFREQAARYAAKDPSFLKFWNSSLRYSFGPIERLA